MSGVTTAVTAVRRLPGDGSMWFFVTGDFLIFCCYIATYLRDRGPDVAGFSRSQHELDPRIGVVNTVLLLTSSLLVVLAVRSSRVPDAVRTRRLLLLGMACGIVFLALKAADWTTLLDDGHTLGATPFFMYYFMLTGLHALHVVLGLGILAGVRRSPNRGRVETGATYWHLVDVIWLLLFACFYRVR